MSNKIALVTGASRGIGKAICLKLAKMGMDIAFTYSSREEEALKTAEECKALGVNAICIKSNVADPGECAATVKTVMDEMGRIDVLVNNAGITKDNLLLRMSIDDFDAVLKTNAYGTFYMLKEVSKIMLKQKSGSIINMSSVVGIAGNAGQLNYAASKAAVIGMTKSLAKELAPRKIRVNAIAPGFIGTDMTAAMDEKTQEAILSTIPFKSMGKPEDIANMAAFLASEESAYITGQVFAVDGGMTI